MSEKRRVNKLLIGIAIVAALCVLLVMCTGGRESYKPVRQLPDYEQDSAPKDGDTQADTIKALQGYAKEAVDRAKTLNTKTESNMGQVIENRNRVSSLENENESNKKTARNNAEQINDLIKRLSKLNTEVSRLQEEYDKEAIVRSEHGIPEGFGFDDGVNNPDSGKWIDPIELEAAKADREDGGFSNLFSSPKKKKRNETSEDEDNEVKEDKNVPVYTVAKDTTLLNAVAMTAMIGRIPVNGTTPDPYPLKILIGKDNLAANGLELPGIEGMVFSGLAFGDWNLSCVRAQLYSASFIFPDGTIVNHSSADKPLAHITDPHGNCVAGRFVTNAPAFLGQQSLLGGLSAAGAAYAEAQTETQSSAATGTTTSTVIGSIGDKVLGEVVEDTTDEIRQWFLQRQKQSFDAVVVEPGANVAVHVDKALAIDHDEYARRLEYASRHQNSTADLD